MTRRQRPDPLSAGLVRAIRGCSPAPLSLELAELDPWASATFVGAVHRLIFAYDGDAARAEEFAAILPEHEFTLCGNLVADVTAEAALEPDGTVRVRLTALTVED